MKISLATANHLKPLADLFDQYRVFYGQTSDVSAAGSFLQQRLQHQDSVILVAEANDQMAGFTQLYPSFSSVSMRPIWILNDLFVSSAFRRQGVAKQLMDAAANHARQTGAVRLELATQIDNRSAQTLYESQGYSRDTTFYHYSLSL